MFPSTTNNGENSFPPIQPSFYSSRSSFFAGYTDNVHAAFYHHHDQLFHHGSVAPPPSDTVNSWAALSNPMLTNQEMNRLTVDEQYAPPLDNQLHKTPPVKKDRHSKIVTAQGPRDRRVRLSIGIAQQFFGLQDMLGFDKASATLAWLLTKSKASIEELVEMKNSGNELANVQSSVSECENGDSEAKSLANMNQPQNSAKESRAKARARARERTRKKMSTMAEKVVLHGTNPYTPNPSLSSTQLGATNMKPDRDRAESIFHHIVQQPLSTKTKMKPSSISGFHDAKSEEICFPYTTKDWDTASSFTGSSMYANSNISSSKVLQIRETPWEV